MELIKLNSSKKRALSPLITIILLIIVSFALIGIVLSWGKGFTNNTKTTLDNFQEEYTQNNTALFKAIKFYPNNNLIINDLMSETDLNIVGYRILSDHNFPGLNTIVMLPTPIIFSQGDSDAISITRPPANNFDIQLLTNDNKYITVSNIQNYALEPVVPTITSPSNGSSFLSDTNILFSQTTTGGDGTYSCEWKVESTTISTSCDDFNYSFSSGGAKTITLKVTDLEGNTKTVSSSLTIIPPLSVTITSPSNDYVTYSNTPIDFNSSISGGTGSYSCEWYDGLDLLSNNCNFTTFFSVSGTYDISLIVTDSGLVSSKDVNIIIYAPLSASISSPSDGASYFIGESINFNSNISGGTGNYTCSWSSNYDTVISNLCNFSTSSLSENIHTITLSVNDGYMTKNTSETVSVVDPLIETINFSNLDGLTTSGDVDIYNGYFEMSAPWDDGPGLAYKGSTTQDNITITSVVKLGSNPDKAGVLFDVGNSSSYYACYLVFDYERSGLYLKYNNTQLATNNNGQCWSGDDCETEAIWYNVKAYSSGSTKKCKYWPVGDSEPSGWTLEVTNSSRTNGQYGAYVTRGAYVDKVSIYNN